MKRIQIFIGIRLFVKIRIIIQKIWIPPSGSQITDKIRIPTPGSHIWPASSAKTTKWKCDRGETIPKKKRFRFWFRLLKLKGVGIWESVAIPSNSTTHLQRFLSKKEPIPEYPPSKTAKEPTTCDSDSRNRLKLEMWIVKTTKRNDMHEEVHFEDYFHNYPLIEIIVGKGRHQISGKFLEHPFTSLEEWIISW